MVLARVVCTVGPLQRKVCVRAIIVLGVAALEVDLFAPGPNCLAVYELRLLITCITSELESSSSIGQFEIQFENSRVQLVCQLHMHVSLSNPNFFTCGLLVTRFQTLHPQRPF